MEKIKMWDVIPGMCESEPDLEYYKAPNKKTDSCIVIFPGGGYGFCSPHEGEGYAKFLNDIGIDAFVLQYRVEPHRFPLPLLDARRSIRWVRYNAQKFGINPEKIAVMGSSAGGHLAALVSTYKNELEYENQDEIDKIDYLPNYQILCYPVINFADLGICHVGSVKNMLGFEQLELAANFDPSRIADEKTPEAFIWHTSNDGAVNVSNSLRYGERLREKSVNFEMHIFPDGPHGLGLSKNNPYIAKWSDLLIDWLVDNKLL